MFVKIWWPGVALGVLLAQAAAPPARGQVPTPPPSPPGLYYPPPTTPAGDYLRGSADLTRAQGDLMLQQEQARIAREKAKQAKLETQKQTLDEMDYERANTPTLTEEQEQILELQLRRILTHPTDAEVTSGTAFNIMLPYLQGLVSQGTQGPPIRLDPDQLKEVSVTVGNGPSVGPLKKAGALEWPVSLQGPAQKKLDGQLARIVVQARLGKVNARLYSQVQAGLDNMQQELNDRYVKEDGVDVAAYLSGSHYLESLDSAVRALGRPNARQFLNGSYAARGRTVQELVANMARTGLRFAPALPGHEAVYYALFNAFAAYAAGAENGSGFQVRLPPSEAVRRPRGKGGKAG